MTTDTKTLEALEAEMLKAEGEALTFKAKIAAIEAEIAKLHTEQAKLIADETRACVAYQQRRMVTGVASTIACAIVACVFWWPRS